jgi:hypothetical protein
MLGHLLLRSYHRAAYYLESLFSHLEKEIAGWQLSWIFKLLHMLYKTNQVGYANTYKS